MGPQLVLLTSKDLESDKEKLGNENQQLCTCTILRSDHSQADDQAIIAALHQRADSRIVKALIQLLRI